VIAYFDTSAIVPLLVQEPGSERAASLWDEADRIVSLRLVHVEARAAVAQAQRLGRLTPRQLRDVVNEFETLYYELDELDLVDVDDALVRRAGDLAQARALRGYDAAHLAAAVQLQDPDLILVAGDAALLDPGDREGLTTARLTGPTA
jgi:predicted nucleic acid-binding protein